MRLLTPLGLFFVIFDIATALTFSNSVLTLDSTTIKLSCFADDGADYSLAARSAVECAKLCNKEALGSNCSRFNFFKGSGLCKMFRKGSTYNSGATTDCTALQIFVKSLTDGCPSGFIFEASEVKCYGILNGFWNWIDARNECNKMSTNPVIIESKLKNESVNNYLTKVGKNIASSCFNNMFLSYGIYIWIGGQRIDPSSKSEFVWKPFPDVAINFTFTFWKTGEPNFLLSNEACLALSTDLSWNDNSCSDGKCVLCESDYTGVNN